MLPNAKYQKLMSEVAYPNWNQAILPMTRFKGHQNVYKWRARFLCVYTMFLAEAETFSLSRKLLRKDDLYHVCGRHSVPEKMSLLGTIGRIQQIPSLLNRYAGFKDYLYYLLPHGWEVTRIGESGVPRKDEVLQYPYIQGKPRSEHDMLLAVHRLIPARLDSDFRGEICQDIFVDLLSGKATIENLPDHIAKYIRAARKHLPDLNGFQTVSLDEELNDNGYTRAMQIERFSAEDLAKCGHSH